MENKIKLTPEQKELLTDLVEFYNSHAVETISFGHTRKFGELGIWSWSFVSFTLKTNRTVLFRFKRTLITSAFEEKTEQYRNELANYIKNVKTDLVLIMLGIGGITMIACGFIVCVLMGKI